MKKLDFNEKGVIVLNYDQKLDEMSDDDRIAIEGMNPSDHQVCAKSKLLDSSVRARATPTTISPAQAQLRNEADELKIKLDAMGTEQRPIVGARRSNEWILCSGMRRLSIRTSRVGPNQRPLHAITNTHMQTLLHEGASGRIRSPPPTRSLATPTHRCFPPPSGTSRKCITLKKCSGTRRVSTRRYAGPYQRALTYSTCWYAETKVFVAEKEDDEERNKQTIFSAKQKRGKQNSGTAWEQKQSPAC